MNYIDVFLNGYFNYANYLWNEILHPHWNNYFYWLIGLSLFVYILELIFPWRKDQNHLRKDFWLDTFYMFFNFFIFSLILFNGLSDVFVQLFKDFLSHFEIRNVIAIEIGHWNKSTQLLAMFVCRDFIQWNIHRLLHKVSFLWKFHKVHHSVTEMGFAAHLRYHWMENIVYRTIEYIPLAMIGFGIDDFFIVHIFALFIGHLNHSNIGIDYGVFRYLLNNPKMHIWHHAKKIPNANGVNFGISLSIWDYLFKTNYIPKDGKNIVLGFEDMNTFPRNFIAQNSYGFKNE